MIPERSSPNSVPPDERLTLMWYTLVGVDGSNGLRSTVKNHETRLSNLEGYNQRLNLIWRLIQWLALALSTVVGVLASGPAGQIIAGLLGAGR